MALAQRFGQRLKLLRMLKNLTQARLAELTGLTTQYLSRIERGLASPSFPVIESICAALDTQPANLFLFDDNGERLAESREIPPRSGPLDWASYMIWCGSWREDLTTGRTTWSESLCQLLGRPPGSTRPSFRLLLEHVHPDDVKAMEEAYSRLLDGQPVNNLELRLIRSDGAQRTAILHTAAEACNGDHLKAIWGVLLDVTGWKQLEATLLNNREELEAHVRQRTLELGRAVKLLEREAEQREGAEHSLHRYEKVVAASADLLGMVDRDYVYRVANPCYEDLFGVPPSEVVGRSVPELFGREFFEDFLQPRLDACLAGEVVRYRAWIPYSATGQRYVEATYTPCVEDGEVVGAVVTGRDLTDVLAMESDLVEQRAAMEAVFEHTQDTIIILDGEGRVLALNEAAAARHGKTREEMLGTNVFSHMEERVAEYRWAKALEALQKKQPVRFHDASSEWSFDTVLIPLESTGRSKARLAVVAHETTGLYKAMERLQAEKERFRLLYGHAPVPYQSLDAQGRFLEVNQAFRQTLGYESEEILGRPFTDLLPPEWEPHFRENFLRFKAKGRVSGVELELLTKDGRRLWAAFAGVIDYDTKGNVLRTQCVFQDITDRKRAEEGLQQAQRNAERLARTKSDFLATMSHEIRTPLNGLMGMLQLARLADLDEESASCVDMAMDAARSLITIINDVLDLSKVEAGRLELVPEPTELHELMDRVLALFRDQADRKGLRLWWEAAGDVPRRVLTDPGRLRQILLNLVSNAVKFTRKGSVAVLVESCDGSDEPSKTELAVTVADTGPGIPDEAREQLFEPFVQADQEYRERLAGTGLGLSIVRRLTDLFGGRVDVHSEPGLGSAFRITVPVQPLQETPDKPLDDEGLIQEAQQKLQGRRVLVVDDDKVSRLAACGLLDRHGLEARAVDNGRDALEKLRRERFHAVLLDVQMPEMGGLDVVRRIRSGNPDKALADLPVVGLTGHAMPEQRREFLSAGMDECLDKPVDRVRLLRVLCDVLGED